VRILVAQRRTAHGD